MSSEKHAELVACSILAVRMRNPVAYIDYAFPASDGRSGSPRWERVAHDELRLDLPEPIFVPERYLQAIPDIIVVHEQMVQDADRFNIPLYFNPAGQTAFPSVRSPQAGVVPSLSGWYYGVSNIPTVTVVYQTRKAVTRWMRQAIIDGIPLAEAEAFLNSSFLDPRLDKKTQMEYKLFQRLIFNSYSKDRLEEFGLRYPTFTPWLDGSIYQFAMNSFGLQAIAEKRGFTSSDAAGILSHQYFS